MKHTKVAHSTTLWLCALISLLASFSFFSCGTKDADSKPPSPTPPKDTLRADSIVEAMYNLYINKHYDEYVKMQAGCDGKPKEYVEQTITLQKLLRERQDTLHRGPKSCKLLRYERHGNDYFDAFLEVEFNDTTSEVILIPMIRQNGKWRQR